MSYGYGNNYSYGGYGQGGSPGQSYGTNYGSVPVYKGGQGWSNEYSQYDQSRGDYYQNQIDRMDNPQGVQTFSCENGICGWHIAALGALALLAFA